MSDWGWFLARPPWETVPPRPEKRERMRQASASYGPSKMSNDYDNELIRLMTPGYRWKRERGRPRTPRSIDLRRAIIVDRVMIGFKELGRKETRAQVVAGLQELVRSGELSEETAKLFPHGNLTFSISRGMRELARLRAAFAKE